jgi:3-hydroxybutyrate dehydrogenase
MTIDLSNKTAVVTGAASGIGFAIASSLKASGAAVCLIDLQLDALETAAAELDSISGRAVTCVADVSDIDQVERMRENAVRDLGTVDILINCAGLQYVSPLEEFPLEQWDRLMNVMLRGSFLCTQQFLPGMMSNGWGRIINVASIHSVVASKFKSAYVSAKHGLIGLTKTAALEAAESGVTVNAVSPAYVRTPLVERQIASQAAHHGISEEEVIKQIMLTPMPQKELIDADEIGEIVVFLCSEAARHINGHNLVVDGGWTVA